MLFTSDEQEDFKNVLAVIEGFTEGLGIAKLNVDFNKIETILRIMRVEFPAQGGLEMASPFKKASSFLCYFVSERPVIDPFPTNLVGDHISKIKNHQNAMLGLHIAIDALHGAVMFREDGDVVLHNKIALSHHLYVDIVHACASLPPMSHFHIISVFLEQMAYRTNPDASYSVCI